MPKPFPDDQPVISRIQRVRQISESHCGPAVIQMLLSNVGVVATQEVITAAAGVEDRIEDYGTTIDELSRAVGQLAPQYQFWYKKESSLDELIEIVNVYGYPVGVEWQGDFGQDDEEYDLDDDEDEYEEKDYGHYSVVTQVDEARELVVIADPYREFAFKDRYFSLSEFDARWWDYNDVTDPKTGYTSRIYDDHLMFMITPKGAYFPKLFDMQRISPSPSTVMWLKGQA